MSSKLKIVFFASNPQETDALRIDQEVRSITHSIRMSEFRDIFELVSLWAVRDDDLLQALNEHKPAIVHFSGHGNSAGELIFMDKTDRAKPVTPEKLKVLFSELKDNIRLVILNACYSKKQADAIAEVIDCVIGMNNAIKDQAAIAFATSFYRALGFGRSVREAFGQGKVSLLFNSTDDQGSSPSLQRGIVLEQDKFTEDYIPELIERKGVDSSQILLAKLNTDILGKGIRTPLEPAKILEIQTAFFNNLTQALWQWRYLAIKLAYYGRQGNKETGMAMARHYDEEVWKVFPEIRTEISRSQRYVSEKTFNQLRNLYAFIVEFDKKISSLLHLFDSSLNEELALPEKQQFAMINDQIYYEVTNRIEDAIGSVAAELRLGVSEN